MMNRECCLYIAMSLDGYIAGPNGELDFLSTVEQPGEDYGYAEFYETVDTLFMGGKTYDKVLSFGIDFPHRGKESYVWSASRSGRDENVTFVNGDPGAFVRQLKQQPGKRIYCDGGSELIRELLRQDEIDYFRISIIPQLLGAGIPLFREGIPAQKLRLTQTAAFPSGLVQLTYQR